MISFFWPILLLIVSNTVYQVCAKSVPNTMNPFASLTITYLVGAFFSAILYFVLSKDTSLIREYSKMNWAPPVLGLVIVGLEVGFIYAYKAGWQVSTATVVQSAFLAITLLIVGFLLYQEVITWSKVTGVVICLVGLYFINK